MPKASDGSEFLLVKRIHRCDKPNIKQMQIASILLDREAMASGSVWRCSCGKYYLLTNYRLHYYWDQISERRAKKILKREGVKELENS